MVTWWHSLQVGLLLVTWSSLMRPLAVVASAVSVLLESRFNQPLPIASSLGKSFSFSFPVVFLLLAPSSPSLFVFLFQHGFQDTCPLRIRAYWLSGWTVKEILRSSWTAFPVMFAPQRKGTKPQGLIRDELFRKSGNICFVTCMRSPKVEEDLWF